MLSRNFIHKGSKVQQAYRCYASSSSASGSTNAVKKKGFPFFKLAFGLTLTTGTVAGGTTYFALKDLEFQKLYREHVPEADLLLSWMADFEIKVQNTNLQDIKKNLQDIKKNLQDAALSVGSSVNEMVTKSSQLVGNVKQKAKEASQVSGKYLGEASKSIEETVKQAEQTYQSALETAQGVKKQMDSTLEHISQRVSKAREKTIEFVHEVDDTFEVMKKNLGVDSTAHSTNENVIKNTNNNTIAKTEGPMMTIGAPSTEATLSSVPKSSKVTVTSSPPKKTETSADTKEITENTNAGEIVNVTTSISPSLEKKEQQENVKKESQVSPSSKEKSEEKDANLYNSKKEKVEVQESRFALSPSPVRSGNETEQALEITPSGPTEPFVTEALVVENPTSSTVSFSEGNNEIANETQVTTKEESSAHTIPHVDSEWHSLVSEMSQTVDRIRKMIETDVNIEFLESHITELVNKIQTTFPSIPVKPLKALAEEQEKLLKQQEFELKEEFTKLFVEEKLELEHEFRLKLEQELLQQSLELEQWMHKKLEGEHQQLETKYQSDLEVAIQEERRDRLDRVDAIQHKLKILENVTQDAVDLIDRDAQLVRIVVCVQSLRNAFERSVSFKQELQALKKISGQNSPFVQIVLDSLPSHVAQSGKTMTQNQIDDLFDSTANSIRRVQLMPDEGGPLSLVISYLSSFVMLQKRGYVRGDDVESVLARTEYYLGLNDLDQAARELNQLQGRWPKSMAEDWLKPVRDYLTVKQAIEVLETHAALSSFKSI